MNLAEAFQIVYSGKPSNHYPGNSKETRSGNNNSNAGIGHKRDPNSHARYKIQVQKQERRIKAWPFLHLGTSQIQRYSTLRPKLSRLPLPRINAYSRNAQKLAISTDHRDLQGVKPEQEQQRKRLDVFSPGNWVSQAHWYAGLTWRTDYRI